MKKNTRHTKTKFLIKIKLEPVKKSRKVPVNKKVEIRKNAKGCFQMNYSLS